MELLLLGVLGQVVCLRLLVIQLARRPDDPYLVRRGTPGYVDRRRREKRHRWLLRGAVTGFLLATAVALSGLVLTLRS